MHGEEAIFEGKWEGLHRDFYRTPHDKVHLGADVPLFDYHLKG
jgi:hypothetical protein